jgi:hypothetical protein
MVVFFYVCICEHMCTGIHGVYVSICIYTERRLMDCACVFAYRYVFTHTWKHTYIPVCRQRGADEIVCLYRRKVLKSKYVYIEERR